MYVLSDPYFSLSVTIFDPCTSFALFQTCIGMYYVSTMYQAIKVKGTSKIMAIASIFMGARNPRLGPSFDFQKLIGPPIDSPTFFKPRPLFSKFSKILSEPLS